VQYRRRGTALLAVLSLSGLTLVGAATASAGPGYRLAFGSTVYTAAHGGPLIIEGHRSSTAESMLADQIIERTDGSTTTRPNIGQLVYEEYPGSLSHRHWHYKGFVRYQLRAATDLALVRPDNKAGFCLADPMYAPDYCGSQKPEALSVDEGLGPNTNDYYNPNLEGQYIDVTDVPPGDYWLVHWVNSSKEICESDYANNAAAAKIALWPNGYGLAPYFTLIEVREPFQWLYDNLNPPLNCGDGPPPPWSPPDLVQRTPTELTVNGQGPGANAPPTSDQPAAGPPLPSPAPTVASAPTLKESLARRYVVRALTKLFHRRPTRLRQACRRLSRTSFLCRVRWRYRRYRYRGSVQIFTTRRPNGFERRFNLRVRRTDTRCTTERRRRCSRTIKARNVRF
jgi:Lysyl oxidase